MRHAKGGDFASEFVFLPYLLLAVAMDLGEGRPAKADPSPAARVRDNTAGVVRGKRCMAGGRGGAGPVARGAWRAVRRLRAYNEARFVFGVIPNPFAGFANGVRGLLSPAGQRRRFRITYM